MAKNRKNANYVTEKTDLAKAQKNKTKSNKKMKQDLLQALYVVLAVVAVVVFVTGFVHIFKACSKGQPREFLDPAEHSFEVTDIVELDFEKYGKVRIELYGKEAPETVANFKKMVEEGYFNGKYMSISSSSTNEYISFSHGGLNEEDDHDHANEAKLYGEFYDNGFVNKISHTYGVITMSRHTGTYYSSATDFMIIFDDDDDDQNDDKKENGTSENNNKYANETSQGYNGSNAAFGRVVLADMSIIEEMAEDYRATANSKAEEEDETKLSSGTNKIELTKEDIANIYVDRTFTPEYTGVYVFEGDSKLIGLTIDDGKEEILGKVEKYLVAGKEYKLKLTISKTAVEGKATLKINDRILSNGDNSVTVTKKDKTDKIVFDYYYTAPVTAKYTLTLSSLKDIVIKDKNGEEVKQTVNGDVITITLTGGEVYTIEVPATGAKIDDSADKATGKIKVEGRYLDINEEEKIKITKDEVEAETTVYPFVTGVAGRYFVTGVGLGNITILDENDKKIDVGNAVLEAGKTYKLSFVTKELSAGKEYKLTIKEPVLSVGDNTAELIVDNSDAEKKDQTKSTTNVFVAEMSGRHLFTLDTDKGTVKIYDENGKLINEYAETTKKDGKEVTEKKIRPYADLEEGKTYTITVSFKNFDKDKCTLTIDDPNLEVNTVLIEKEADADGKNGTYKTRNTIYITKLDIDGKKVLKYVYIADKTGIYGLELEAGMEKHITITQNGKKLEKYDYLRVNEDDVFEFTINTENVKADASTICGSANETTITVTRGYAPRIQASVLADKIAK